jgi:hypothetical protein
MRKHDAAIKTLKYWLSIAAFVMWVSATVELRADQTVVVRSGNGTIGSQDSLIHVLPFGTTGDITPTPANFSNAQTAPQAYVVTPYVTYIPTLPSDPNAKWIAVNTNLPQGSALFAVAFQVTDPTITTASLDFHFSVDNAVNGVFINGNRISGNSLDGDYHAEYRFVRFDIAPLLIPNSTNWLYVNMSDYGALAALIFNATITTSSGGAGTEGISPNHGGNAGTVTVRVTGSGFQLGAQVRLTGVGTDVAGSDTSVLNSSILTSSFNLVNAPPGLRNVVVTNPDNSSVTLAQAFTVEQGGSPQSWVNIIAPSKYRAGRDVSFYVLYGNRGNVDALGAKLILTFPSTLTSSLGFGNEVGVVTKGIFGTNTVVTVELGRISAGSSSPLPIVLTSSSSQAPFNIQATIQTH